MKTFLISVLAFVSVVFAGTVAASPIDDFHKSQIDCLAKNIFFEARSESLKGQVAVAFVTFNRVNSKSFPDDVCSVVLQRKQFSWTHDGKSDNPNWSDKIEVAAWRSILSLAKDMYTHPEKYSDPTEGSVLYHADYVKPFWADHYVMVSQIGTHIFYRKD